MDRTHRTLVLAGVAAIVRPQPPTFEKQPAEPPLAAGTVVGGLPPNASVRLLSVSR